MITVLRNRVHVLVSPIDSVRYVFRVLDEPGSRERAVTIERWVNDELSPEDRTDHSKADARNIYRSLRDVYGYWPNYEG